MPKTFEIEGLGQFEVDRVKFSDGLTFLTRLIYRLPLPWDKRTIIKLLDVRAGEYFTISLEGWTPTDEAIVGAIKYYFSKLEADREEKVRMNELSGYERIRVPF